MNPSDSLIKTLLLEKPVLTDGAWGTQLQARGLPLTGEPAESWNLTRPERVEEVARSYAEAGSRILLTNTFSGNRIALARHGLADSAREINRAGAAISRRAAPETVSVFASIGPSGAMLLTGEVSESDLDTAFSEQAEALAEGGANGIVIETMSDLVEARIAVAAAVRTGLPVVACMVFDSGRDKDRTMMGVTPEAAAEGLADAGAAVIGANCGNGPEGYLPVCRRLSEATELPVWIKPNAGLPEVVEGRATYSMTPEDFAEGVARLVEAGADFVGGCCGTSPEFLRVLARRFAPDS